MCDGLSVNLTRCDSPRVCGNTLQVEVLTEQNGDVRSITLLSPCFLTVGTM